MQKATITRALGAAVLIAPLLFISATANAGLGPTAGSVSPSTGEDSEPFDDAPRFDFEVFEAPPCDEAAYFLNDGDPDALIDISDAVDAEEGDPTTGTMDLTGIPAGTYGFQIDCTSDGQTTEVVVGSLEFARLTIVKDVEGDPDPDTTFTIQAECTGGEGDVQPRGEPMSAEDDAPRVVLAGEVIEPEIRTFERQFGADGGSDVVILYGGTVCDVEETDDGGAESTSIEGETADFTEDPIDLETTVTNVFPVADEDDAEEDAEVDDEVEEAVPADPVEAEPTFTG